MPIFRVSDLPAQTMIMHDAEVKWRKKNWEDSLRNHSNEIEELLSLIALFNIWKNRIPQNESTRYLSKEIYTDAYISIHLASYGLYKNAYMSLRSQFETAIRLIYFSSHHHEFKLWRGGEEGWINTLLKGPDVWGHGFKYFNYIQKVKELEDLGSKRLWLLKGDNPKLIEIYSKLSKHVHSGGPYLQTRTGRLSAKYDYDEFSSWVKMFKDVQMYVNILFALCFPEPFLRMTDLERDQVLNLAIGADYKDHVKQVHGL